MEPHVTNQYAKKDAILRLDIAIYPKLVFANQDGKVQIVTFVYHIGTVRDIVKTTHGNVYVRQEKLDQTAKTMEMLTEIGVIGASGLLVLPPVELQCGNDAENVTVQELKEMEFIVRTTAAVLTKTKIAILESVAPHSNERKLRALGDITI